AAALGGRTRDSVVAGARGRRDAAQHAGRCAGSGGPLHRGRRAREARVLRGGNARRRRGLPGGLARLMSAAGVADERDEGDDAGDAWHPRLYTRPSALRKNGMGTAPGVWGITRCARTSTRGGHMSRRVRALPPRALGAAAQPVEIDSYFDKVLKYIPADIGAAWVAVTGLVSSAQDIPRQTV